MILTIDSPLISVEIENRIEYIEIFEFPIFFCTILLFHWQALMLAASKILCWVTWDHPTEIGKDDGTTNLICNHRQFYFR